MGTSHAAFAAAGERGSMGGSSSQHEASHGTRMPRLCLRCGRDCSNYPHVQTNRRIPICRECLRPHEIEQLRSAYRKAQAAREAAALAGPPAPEPDSGASAIAGPPPAHEDDPNVGPAILAGARADHSDASSDAPDDAIEGYALADDGTFMLAPETAVPQRNACPGCFRHIPEESVICVNCGYDKRVGLASSSALAGVAKQGKLFCHKCKYDLSGIRGEVCPECGTRIERDANKLYLQKESKRAERNAYLSPVLWTLAGLAVTGLIMGLAVSPAAAGVTVGFYAIQTAIGFVVYLCCCATFIGWDSPLKLELLRLGAVYGVTLAAVAASSLIANFQCFGMIFIGVIFVGSIMKFMDLEMADAVIFAGIAFLVHFGLAVAIRMMML
ncbi:MAG: hypothetical protein RBS39_09090 [Phycisphaerales bacterium]|jgi:predicted amidophosphoribosyltransferase|nr:hypothetical protein [Phycisphaerales bacterium]